MQKITSKPAIDGGYSEWSQWEVLSIGKKRRTRTCTSPTPKFGGANCIGTDEEVVDVVLRKKF